MNATLALMLTAPTLMFGASAALTSARSPRRDPLRKNLPRSAQAIRSAAVIAAGTVGVRQVALEARDNVSWPP